MNKLHLFYANNSNPRFNSFASYLEAYIEENNGIEITFKQIERICIHSIIDNYNDYVMFEYFHDTNSCFYSGHTSIKEFTEWKESTDYNPIDLQNYERIRKVILARYAKHNQGINFNKITL